jgi:hypothetical protein
MKKGTLVKFIGDVKLMPLQRTYVYGTRADKILIEHPQGNASDDPTVKEYLLANYSLSPTKKQFFIEANANELIALNPDGTEMQLQPVVQQLPDAETFVDEDLTITVPKSFLLNLKQYFVAQKQSMDPNAEIPGIPSFLSKALKSFMSKNQKEVLELSDYMINQVDAAFTTIKVEGIIHEVEPLDQAKQIQPMYVDHVIEQQQPQQTETEIKEIPQENV